VIEGALKRLSKKVDEAEIFHLASRTITIKTKKFSIEMFKEKSSEGYGIRVIKDGKVGFYFSNALTNEALEMAVRVSRSAQKDKYQSLPQQQNYESTRYPVFEMDVEEGIEMTHELLLACRDYKEVSPTSGTLSWSNSETTIANTNDVYGGKEESAISVYVATVARDMEPATGFHFEVSRKKDINASEIGKTACKLANDSRNAKRLAPAKKRVILRPVAVTELLEHTLIPSFSADNVQRGRSKLQGMIGEEVFKGINIADDAKLEGGLMSENFDDEGVATQTTTLVEKGVLKGFLYDTYTANKEGRMSTGNGGRSSHSSLPGVGASNFILSGENRTDEEEGTLVVYGLIGAHTANPISGDFSCEIRNAFLDGVSIKKAIVSGNIFDMLKAGVSFGKDYKQYSSVLAPSIEFPEVTVVG
jgi:PmbA protein